MINGKVTRPLYGDGDGLLTLAATISKGTVTKVKTFNASVREAGMTSTQRVAADKIWLDIPGKDAIISDINLPYLSPNDSTITWGSSDEDTITSNGNVTRPANGEGITTVLMTAVITNGAVTDTQVITCKVLPWTDQRRS